MGYNKDVLDLIKATISNSSVKIEYNSTNNANEPVYIIQGLDTHRTMLTFEQLYNFYENKLNKIK